MMKHTEVMMRLKDDDYKEDEQRRRKEVHDTLNIIQSRLIAIDQVGKTEGWKLFVDELLNEERRLLRMIETVDNPTHLAKLTGTLLAVKSFISWVPATMMELEAQAQSLTSGDNK